MIPLSAKRFMDGMPRRRMMSCRFSGPAQPNTSPPSSAMNNLIQSLRHPQALRMIQAVIGKYSKEVSVTNRSPMWSSKPIIVTSKRKPGTAQMSLTWALDLYFDRRGSVNTPGRLSTLLAFLLATLAAPDANSTIYYSKKEALELAFGKEALI